MPPEQHDYVKPCLRRFKKADPLILGGSSRKHDRNAAFNRPASSECGHADKDGNRQSPHLEIATGNFGISMMVLMPQIHIQASNEEIQFYAFVLEYCLDTDWWVGIREAKKLRRHL